MAESEFKFASELAHRRGWNFRTVKTSEVEDPRWLRNDSERCYFCKAELFSTLGKVARDEGIAHILYGAIPEDKDDFRPGHRAAGEYSALAPLAEVGLTKPEIRALSRTIELPSWDKPQAACLASRFPTGTAITVTTLSQVEKAEAALVAHGFRGHRVRHHGTLARIEIQQADWPKIGDPAMRARVTASLNAIGYKHVTLDLAGYRPAGLNQ
jgi:uncharacterized protein